MNKILQADLWVTDLERARSLYSSQQPVIRTGSNPVVDLLCLKEIAATSEFWFVYPESAATVDLWNELVNDSEWEDRLMVSTCEQIWQQLTGDTHHWRELDNHWLVAVTPEVVSTRLL